MVETRKLLPKFIFAICMLQGIFGVIAIAEPQENTMEKGSKSEVTKKDWLMLDIDIKPTFSHTFTNVTISQPQRDGALDVKGTVDGELFGIGAIHKFKGRVEMQGLGFEKYIFEGNENDPLIFSCLSKKQYVYMGGTGRVIFKENGQVIELQKQK